MARASLEQIPVLDEAQGSMRRVSRWREEGNFEAIIGDPATFTSGLAPSAYVPPRLLPESGDAEVNDRPTEVLDPLQSWEGVVLEVSEDSFTVRLADVAGEHADEEVTLDQEELSDFDLELLEPGAILYWTIGYLRRQGGSRERVSRMRLRRLPAWTKRQLQEAQERAKALEEEIGW
jgi:hypothetical protein